MKISIITFCIAVLLSTGIATAQNISVFGDGFSQGKLESYLENTKILKTGQASFEPSKDGKGKCLVLAKDTSAIFKPVPVKDNVKYKLSFTVRGEMKETIEENPRLELILLSRGNWLPFCNIAFLDAEMKPLAWCNYEHTLPFGSHFNFTELFHPPEKAAFLQLSIQTRKDSKIFLSDISLVPASDEGAINVNPTFSLGKYNFSGWPRRHTNGRILEKPDGKFVFDTGYGSGSETIPLSKPGTYRLYAKGSTYGGYSMRLGLA